MAKPCRIIFFSMTFLLLSITKTSQIHAMADTNTSRSYLKPEIIHVIPDFMGKDEIIRSDDELDLSRGKPRMKTRRCATLLSNADMKLFYEKYQLRIPRDYFCGGVRTTFVEKQRLKSPVIIDFTEPAVIPKHYVQRWIANVKDDYFDLGRLRFTVLEVTIPKNVAIVNVKMSKNTWKSGRICRYLEMELEHPCYVEMGGKLLYYEKVVKGMLYRHGTLFEVSGIQVMNSLFSWLPVTQFDARWKRDGVVVIQYQKDPDSGVPLEVEELPWKHFVDIPMCRKPEHMDWFRKWKFFA